MNISDAVDGFVAGYFSTCRRSEKTQSAYKIDLVQLRQYLGETQLAAVEPDRLEQWALDMKSRGYTAVSIRRKFATARVFFTYWIRRGIIDKSPLWRIRLDLGRGRVFPRSLAPADAKRLIEQVWRASHATEPVPSKPGAAGFLALRNVAALEIMFATGMRVGELVGLKLQDWHEAEASFVVNGKGSRQRLAFLPDDRSQKAVAQYVNLRRSVDCGHDAILLNAMGKKITTQGIARAITATAKAADIAVRVTPHMIRHTVATLLLRYGADIRVVQEVLGHASIATTQRYTHVSKDHLLSTLRERHPSYHLNIELTAKAS